jgi:hypothetical protein
MIAGGLGCFAPRKPELTNLEKFEDHGVEYIIKIQKYIVIKNCYCRRWR